MTTFQNTILILAMAASFARAQILPDKHFTRVADNVVLANESMSAELQSRTWKNAEAVWSPSEADVLTAIAHLKSDAGKREILLCGGRETDMNPSITQISASRYQVFGLIIRGRKQILLDASPVDPRRDRYSPDLWLREIISAQVLDGGPAYWWVLFDSELAQFVNCNRRP